METTSMGSTERILDDALRRLNARINRLLPPRYQHCFNAVAPGSMGSAELKYGPDGRVAWDDIWTSFCDLALAGGPPHRGRLLEPVCPDAVAAQPERYEAVVKELGRAIALVTERSLVAGYAPGWVGLPCASGPEAAWLHAALVAENVAVRCRETTLQLPAGPDFRIEREVKNVVVALAKVCHYWDGHLSDTEQSLFTEVTQHEPATAAEIAAHPRSHGDALARLEVRMCSALGLTIDTTRYAGWAGVACVSEAMAAWLLRAAVVEGLRVRREGQELYLPVRLCQSADETEQQVEAFAGVFKLWQSLDVGPG